jgi:hypothetical protein
MIGAISHQMPQSPASHSIRERAHCVCLSAIDARYFEAVLLAAPVRFVDHRETPDLPRRFRLAQAFGRWLSATGPLCLKYGPSPIPRR